MDRRARWRALLVSAAVVIAVVAPGVRLLVSPQAPDGFPLSTYPMFTRDRGRVVELATVVAESPEGEVERLSPRTIARTDQVVQAGVTVRRAVSAGAGAADPAVLGEAVPASSLQPVTNSAVAAAEAARAAISLVFMVFPFLSV